MMGENQCLLGSYRPLQRTSSWESFGINEDGQFDFCEGEYGLEGLAGLTVV